MEIWEESGPKFNYEMLIKPLEFMICLPVMFCQGIYANYKTKQ